MGKLRELLGARGMVEGRDYKFIDEVRSPSGASQGPHVHTTLTPEGMQQYQQSAYDLNRVRDRPQISRTRRASRCRRAGPRRPRHAVRAPSSAEKLSAAASGYPKVGGTPSANDGSATHGLRRGFNAWMPPRP